MRSATRRPSPGRNEALTRQAPVVPEEGEAEEVHDLADVAADDETDDAEAGDEDAKPAGDD